MARALESVAGTLSPDEELRAICAIAINAYIEDETKRIAYRDFVRHYGVRVAAPMVRSEGEEINYGKQERRKTMEGGA